MKLINEMQNRPTLLLAMMIVIICITIVIVIIVLIYRLANEKRVLRAALELKKITNSIRAGLVHFTIEDNGRILYASKGFYDLVGYDKNEIRTINKLYITDYVHSEDTYLFDHILDKIKDNAIRFEVRLLTQSGENIFCLMSGTCSMTKDGRHTLSVVFVDISEQKKMQELILLEGERYRIATELSKDVIFEYHIKTDEMIFTDKFRDLFGQNPVISNYNRTCSLRREYVHPDDWGLYLEFCEELAAGKSIIESELRIRDRLGEYIWCQMMGKTIFGDDKRPIRVIGKLLNIDNQKRELEALEYKATRDPLTNVYNKEVTIKKIDKFISGNKSGMHVLMLVDFDDFKSINDHYGHLLGDKVLVFVINRIREIFSEGEIIGRIGGDEFVVFAGNITDINEVMAKAKLLKIALDTNYLCNDFKIKISGSIGVAVYPEAGLHYEQLMERADQALYKVKEHGKNNFMLYSTIM